MSTPLGGRYRLDSLIGGGGMGEVWAGHDEVLDRPVAIKVIRPHLAEDENIRARLRVEAQLAGSMHHPGIVDVFDYGEDEQGGRSVPYIVMPLIAGAPLSAVLADRGTLSTGETMAVVSEIAAALQVAHEAGIVHRDLKPGNILVTPDERVMLVDFGIAHASGGEALTQTGTLIGTADYLSPEQASGSTATPASDLYSLGVVAFTCLSGTLPFHRDTDIATALAHLRDDVPDLPDTVPAEAVALVAALLAKKPADRPSSATVVATSAAAIATSVPPPPGQEPAIDGEPTMPDAEARPEQTLPGIVERPVSVGAGLAATVVSPAGPPPDTSDGGLPGSGSVVAAEHVRRRRPRRMMLLSSVLVALVAAAVGWTQLGGSDAVRVPDVVGTSQRVATQQLEAKGLDVEVRSVNVADAKRGVVVGQDPRGRQTVDRGAVVILSVATGRVRIPVDELVGETYEQGVARLDKLGLKAQAAYEPSDEAAGTVVAVDPSRTAKIGSTVTLSVANGILTDTADDDGTGKDKGKSKNPPGKGKGKGKGADQDPQPEPSASPPAPSPTPEPSATP